jgi:DNA-binding CsgD family transcriptional regulator
MNMMEKRDVLVWRLTAVIICLACLTGFLVRVFVWEPDVHELDLLSGTVLMGFQMGMATLLIALIIFPRELYIHAALCAFWSLTSVIDGGSFVPISLYLLGCLFALKRGFFSVHVKRKTVVVGLVLLAALATQFRYSLTLLITNGLELFVFFLVAGIAESFFHHELQKLRGGQEDVPRANVSATLVADTLLLYLKPALFTAQDVAILQKVLDGAKYMSIAHDQNIAISTLKNRVRVLYSKIGVPDRTAFMSRYSRYILKLALSPEPVTVTSFCEDEAAK